VEVDLCAYDSGCGAGTLESAWNPTDAKSAMSEWTIRRGGRGVSVTGSVY
jgi:hypothetical protein